MDDIVLRSSDGEDEFHSIPLQPSGETYPEVRRERKIEGGDYKTEQWTRQAPDSNVFELRSFAGRNQMPSTICYRLPS